jgi:hypothetical protein
MTRQFKNGTCSCWKPFQKKLDEQGTDLELAFSLSGKVYLQVQTMRTDGQRKPPVRVVCSHCPFCGEKLK